MTSSCGRIGIALLLSLPATALAQSGVSDGRVSLPDGPGSIGGVGENVDINANMGSASFSVPLRVPRGFNQTMTPSLGLSYSSGQGIGTVGIGWDIASPSIERTTDKGLPEYTSADRFAADGGSELVFIGMLDGTRVYRTRFESGFVRYRWRNAGTGASGYWTAEYPDGRVGYFGATADGTLVPSARVQADTGETFRYHLVEIVDVNGRRIVQRFTKDRGWVLLDEVQYAFGGMDTPRFSVRFVYEDRPDIVSNAAPGYEIQLAKRLSEVIVNSEATPIRRYTLAYEMDAASSGMSRLQTVREFGRDGGELPIHHSFEYSRTLGGTCAVGCEQPFVVDMGTVPGGATIATGRAQLVDINGDSLPDMVVSSDTGEHTFYVSELSVDGRPNFATMASPSAQTAGGTSLILGDNGVQIFDVNGDGFSDIVNQRTGDALCNDGSGDWTTTNCLMNATSLPALDDDSDSDVDPEGKRFFDYDNDKRIDLLVTASDSAAQVYRNTGTSYEAVNIQPLGATFDAASNLDLGDMNGDGLLDPVRIVASGSGAIISYRINIGRGQWLDFADVTIEDLPSGLVDSAQLQDLNGDGLDDIVVVAGTSVRYWLNRNAGRFDSAAELVSGDVDGEIPEATGETILFADMNANGTDDIVWVNGSGNVRFLELFPVRPNLLSRIDNGIGFVRVVRYGTAAAERARDQGTNNEWTTTMPNAVNVAVATDTFVTLTGSEDGSGVHERVEFNYHSGFYDGDEKDFRGFELVERRQLADPTMDGQDPGLSVLEYDVGRDDVYRNGLLVQQTDYAGDGTTALRQTRTTYTDCPVAEVDGATPPVRFICDSELVVVTMEGRPAAEWTTIRTEKDYDGYGNVVAQRDFGVVNMNSPESPAACGACDAPAGLASGACGADCTGDEQTFATTYITPGADTDGRWLLRLATSEVRMGDSESRQTQYYYDGPDFVGLDLGQATRGNLTRSTVAVASGEVIPGTRLAYDSMGSVVASLDPNGDPSRANTHRRDYEYDSRSLRVTRVTVRVGDHDLVQDVSYESSFLKTSESTSFRVVSGGSEQTPRNPSRYRYDEFGRLASIIRPGDSDGMPTEEFTYELGDPVSRVLVQARREVGGPMNVESVICRDGLNRTVQTRTRLADGRYQVDGFVVRNGRGQVIRAYQPYVSTSANCEMLVPDNVRFAESRYDALGRAISSREPDDGIHGSASTTRTEYLPLATVQYDANDTDSASDHADTPITTLSDGLGRIVGIERALTTSESATYRVFYDGLGRVTQVSDPAGNTRQQTFDLAGRVTRTVDPNRGATTIELDAAGNATRITDARGMTQELQYDGLNRRVMRWNSDDMMGSLEQTIYDFDAECADCRNGAGRIVGQRYPLPTDGSAGHDAFGYDARGRRNLLRRTLEGTTFETSYVFDAAGAVTEATFPTGQTLTFTYDDAQRPLSVTADGSVVVDGASYSDQGRLVSFSHSNGVDVTMGYDDLLRVESMQYANSAGGFYDIALNRDRAGNVLEITDGVSAAEHPSHAASYQYDAWYRVTEAMLDGETISVGYDSVDNITSRTSSLGAASVAHVGDYAYSGAGPNAATSVGSTSYGYDDAGQVQTRGNLRLIWDHLGRLSEADNGSDHVSQFAYAPTGERVLKSEHGGAT